MRFSAYGRPATFVLPPEMMLLMITIVIIWDFCVLNCCEVGVVAASSLWERTSCEAARSSTATYH